MARLRGGRVLVISDQKQRHALVSKGAEEYAPRLAESTASKDIHRRGGGIHSRPLPLVQPHSVPAAGPSVVSMSLWHQCLRRLEAELPEQAFNTWIRPLQAVEDGDRLRLLAPNRYVVDWVNQNCTARISELVDELVPAPAPQVVVEIGSRRPAGPTPTQMTDGVGLPVQPRPAPPAAPARPATFESQPGAPPRR